MEIKKHFIDIKKTILEKQAYWEIIDPHPHAVDV